MATTRTYKSKAYDQQNRSLFRNGAPIERERLLRREHRVQLELHPAAAPAQRGAGAQREAQEKALIVDLLKGDKVSNWQSI